MTLNDLIPVLDKDQQIVIWFSDDIIGVGSISTLKRRKAIKTLLDRKVTTMYVYNNELHIYTDFK